MKQNLKLLIPTLLCTAWCGACVWYARTYVGAGSELIPFVEGRRTHRMLSFNATTLGPTSEERVAMVEGMQDLVTWKLMIDPLDGTVGPVQLRFEVREIGKPPIVLFNNIHTYVDASKNSEPFPILIGMKPVGGSITKASKLEFRVVEKRVTSPAILGNPFRLAHPGSYGIATSIPPGAYANVSSQSVPLYSLSYGDDFPKREKVLFLTIRRLPKGYFGD